MLTLTSQPRLLNPSASVTLSYQIFGVNGFLSEDTNWYGPRQWGQALPSETEMDVNLLLILYLLLSWLFWYLILKRCALLYLASLSLGIIHRNHSAVIYTTNWYSALHFKVNVLEQLLACKVFLLRQRSCLALIFNFNNVLATFFLFIEFVRIRWAFFISRWAS